MVHATDPGFLDDLPTLLTIPKFDDPIFFDDVLKADLSLKDNKQSVLKISLPRSSSMVGVLLFGGCTNLSFTAGPSSVYQWHVTEMEKCRHYPHIQWEGWPNRMWQQSLLLPSLWGRQSAGQINDEPSPGTCCRSCLAVISMWFLALTYLLPYNCRKDVVSNFKIYSWPSLI